ncbi:MAG: hypothetical protein JTT11_00560 [Candidatus Brockarchaeota archaeon]|nr:hypothetical protein [Candidatus Brockarchaeota archaeon]
MNGRDRFFAALDLEEPDLVPLAPYLDRQMISKVCGIPLARYVFGSAESVSRWTLKGNQHFDFDWAMIPLGNSDAWFRDHRVTFSDGKAFVRDFRTGETRTYEDNVAPHSPIGILGGAFENADWGEIEKACSFREDYFSTRPIEDAVNALGGKRFLVSWLGMPAVDAYGALGDGYFISLHKEPGKLRRLLDMLAKVEMDWVDHLADLGLDGLWMEECMASSDCINVRHFVNVIWPYEKRVIDHVWKRGMRPLLYFCGGVSDRLRELCALRPSCLAVEESKKGFANEIPSIRSATADELCLMGYINSIRVLPTSDSAGLCEEVKARLGEGSAGGGFILGTGSPILNDTPVGKVELLSKCGRRYGRYPPRLM